MLQFVTVTDGDPKTDRRILVNPSILLTVEPTTLRGRDILRAVIDMRASGLLTPILYIVQHGGLDVLQKNLTPEVFITNTVQVEGDITTRTGGY